MENIEVGEYVRTKEGTIDIVRKYDDKLKFYWCQNGLNIDIRNQIATHLEDVVKHSKNIIDLIEIGDYVNGKEVIGKFYEKGLKMLIIDTKIQNTKIFNKDIKSIVTKEQFKRESYVVEE